MRPLDPVFALPTPLLFARVGGKEAPPSTPLAVAHALDVRADVLAVGVRRTRDRELLAWHTPDLDGVRLAVEDDVPRRRARRDLCEFDWAELDGRAFADDFREGRARLADVPRDPERRLLRVAELFALTGACPLALELAGDLDLRDVRRLVELLDAAPAPRRVLLVAGRAGLAAAEAALGALPPARRARHALGLATREALFAPPAALLPGGTPLCGHALHTSHAFCPAKLVRDVHGRGAAVHVAITPEWPVPGLDADEGRLDRGSLFELLERGVDGVVSDRPREVRRALDDWIAKND